MSVIGGTPENICSFRVLPVLTRTRQVIPGAKQHCLMPVIVLSTGCLTSDTVGVVLYSIVVLLVMLLWVYVPA